MINNKERGFSVLEIVVGVAIISLALFGISTTARDMLRVAGDARLETKAGFILEEGMEAIRTMRDYSWETMSASTTPGVWYYVSASTSDPSTWLSEIPYEIDGVFDRRFTAGDVYRDSEDDIAETGTLDTETKEITMEVTWTKSNSRVITKTVVTYISNLFE